jgi:3-isopropylmalate dehydrogenase
LNPTATAGILQPISHFLAFSRLLAFPSHVRYISQNMNFSRLSPRRSCGKGSLFGKVVRFVDARLVLLPGDGIGPEVVAEGERVLHALARRFGHQFHCDRFPMGGNAIDSHGTPLPDETLAACRNSAAILLGAVGGPKWDDPNAKTRPEAGLLQIRKELGLFANLRPIKPSPWLLDASPLRSTIIEGTDILFVRELTGGLYFGASGRRPHASGEEAFSTMTYNTGEIERVVRVSAQAARKRRGRLTMVDKANVLEASRLWRSVSARIMAEEFPDIRYDVVLVDSMAMHLISRPRDFDVVVTENMFGDILTDEGSMLTGSMGLLPSASLGSSGPGLYEPIHGSAPDIAGKGIANPLATILALAMLLRHSLQLETEALSVETAVDRVLKAGHRTRDIAEGGPSLGTVEMGTRVVEALATA